LRRTIEIIAHRGASNQAPENTLAAFRLAWQESADAIELDVHLSRDDRVVVIHDANTQRTAGVAREVRDQTLDELGALDVGSWKGERWSGERILTAEEVLATIPDGKRAVVEIKCGQEILAELARVIRKSGKTAEQVTIIGFDAETVLEAKKCLPAHSICLLVGCKKDGKSWSDDIGRLIATARRGRLDGLSLCTAGPIDAGLVGKLKTVDMKVFAWTVDAVGEARRLATLGVDGITTNCPGLIRRALTDLAGDDIGERK
jgi:glycerophosphoryl diester phosphodiesterase